MQEKLFYGYRIIETIHTSNRFFICKAYNKENKVVALKIAKKDFFANNPESILVEKAFRKAEAMRAITRKYNPYRLVRVFDVVRTDKVFFIVMEYIAGVSLEETLPRMSIPRNQVDLEEIENKLTDIVRMINEYGYTPATIEASNVMVTPQDAIVLLNYLDPSSPTDMVGPNVVDDFMDKCYRNISRYDGNDARMPAAPYYPDEPSNSYYPDYSGYPAYPGKQPVKEGFLFVLIALLAAAALIVFIFYTLA
jgi:serine/threonine protein kinase